MKYIAALTLGVLAAPVLGQSVPYAGGTYSQNFDGLPTTGNTTISGKGPHALQGVLGGTGVNGWYGANFAGSSGSTEYRAQDGSLGSSDGRGVISYGLNGSSERALGALPTSNQISTIGALFTNTTGQTLTEVTISYTGEQWRRGNTTSGGVGPNTLAFAYGFGASLNSANTMFNPLSFVSPNMQASPTEVALNGNLAGNRAAVSATIQNLTWAPGETLAIAWSINDLSGQDNGMGIDDFSLSAVPAPGAASLLVVAGLLGARRRR